MKQKYKIRNIISITVLNLTQMQNLDLSDYLLIDYPNLKDFFFFILQCVKKEVIKTYFLVIIFFSLVRNRKNLKILIEISKLGLSIGKII